MTILNRTEFQNPEIRNVKGFVDFSMLDYPGEVSAVVFLGGCNMACGYCHNSPLIKPSNIEDLNFSNILEYLSSSKILTGVVVSGGEPTVSGDNLIQLLQQLRKTGLKIKLDTNGTNLDILVKILDLGLVDYIAVDLKTSFDRYSELFSELVSSEVFVENIQKTILYLKNSTFVNWELRSTCWEDLITVESLHKLKDWICCSPVYCLQASIAIDKLNFLDCVKFVRSLQNSPKLITRNVGVL